MIKIKNKNKRKRSFLLNFGLSKEWDDFIEDLLMLISAGMGIITALDVMKVEMRSKRMKKIVENMQEDIGEGLCFWRVLDKTGLFSQRTVGLLKIGEESGRLLENLKVVVLQKRKERVFYLRMRSAMMYPVFVLVLTMIVGIGVAWFILPRLAIVFAGMQVELPMISKVVIAFGGFLGMYGPIFVSSFLLMVVLVVYFFFFSPRTKFIGQVIVFSVPGVRKLLREVELARFGYILGTLLDAGLPLLDVVDSLEQSTSLYAYKRLYGKLKGYLEEGNSFQKSFSLLSNTEKFIPFSIQQLIITGEKSGNLSNTLVKIGESYDEKIEVTTKNLTVILEPLLLIIVWLGVISVALAVILPIYSLIGDFNA